MTRVRKLYNELVAKGYERKLAEQVAYERLWWKYREENPKMHVLRAHDTFRDYALEECH